MLRLRLPSASLSFFLLLVLVLLLLLFFLPSAADVLDGLRPRLPLLEEEEELREYEDDEE